MVGVNLQKTRTIHQGLLMLALTRLAWIQAMPMKDAKSTTATAAVSSIISDFYVPQTKSMTITYHAMETTAARYMHDFLEDLMRDLSVISVLVETMNEQRHTSHHRKFNLILVDSVEALLELHPANLTKDYDIMEFYLVYLMQHESNLEPKEVMAQIFEYFWKYNIINMSLLSEVASNIFELITFFPFMEEQSCHSLAVKTINSFHGVWLNPIVEHSFPYKLWNFQGCPLRIALWHTPPYLSYFPNETGFDRVGDFEGEMLIELAKQFNFSLELIEPPDNEQRGKRHENGTLTGAIKLLQERQVDISLGCFRYTQERSDELTAALPYYQTFQVYCIQLSSRPYSSLEILSFPFDAETWALLCLSLLILMAICCVMQQSRRKVIDIDRAPPTATVLDMVGVFLGMCLSTLPQSKYARYFIVNGFVYGMLMRAAYQSLLFVLMRSNKYREPPHSLTDLIEDGYSLVMTQATFETVSTIWRIEHGLIHTFVVDESAEPSTFAYLEQSEQKLLAAVAPQDYLAYYVGSGANKRGLFYILPEKIFAQHITMYFSKHSYLIERFNFVLMKLRSFGFIDYWASKKLDWSVLHDDGRVLVHAMTLREIGGVFVVYNIMMAVACVVFSLELICEQFSKLRSQKVKFIWTR